MSTPKRPGWYPAPDRNGEQWWNGVSWSESRRSHRAIPPAASVAYNAQTGFYGTPGAPTAVPAALTNDYRPPVAPPPAVTGALQSQALVALVLGVAGLFFNLLAIAALVFGIATYRRNRTHGGARSVALIAGAAILLGIVGLVMMAVQFGLFIWTVILTA